jgi:uncharacterized membrane protein
MDVVEIYRRAFELFKVNYLIAAPFIAVNIIVAFLFSLLAGGLMMAGGTIAGPHAPPIGMLGLGTVLGAAGALLLLSWVLNILAQGMAIGMSSEALSKGIAHLDSGFEVLSKKLGSLIIASILVGMAVGVGLILLIIPGLIIGFLLMFTIIALVVEDLDAIAAMKRSYQVVRANLGDAFVYAVLMIAIGIIAGIVGAIFRHVPVIGSAILSPAIDGLATGLITIAGVIFFTEAAKQTTY